jgi:hypothetical protein
MTKKNSLFAGRDEGAFNWTCLASLIETAKLNTFNPQAYLADVLTARQRLAYEGARVRFAEARCITRAPGVRRISVVPKASTFHEIGYGVGRSGGAALCSHSGNGARFGNRNLSRLQSQAAQTESVQQSLARFVAPSGSTLKKSRLATLNLDVQRADVSLWLALREWLTGVRKSSHKGTFPVSGQGSRRSLTKTTIKR